MDAALAEINSSLSINYTAVAKKHNVHPETLRRHHQGKQQSRRAAHFQSHHLLSEEQEQQLLRYIEKLTGRGLPPTYQLLWNIAQEISGKVPGKN
jgi:transposase-like protein